MGNYVAPLVSMQCLSVYPIICIGFDGCLYKSNFPHFSRAAAAVRRPMIIPIHRHQFGCNVVVSLLFNGCVVAMPFHYRRLDMRVISVAIATGSASIPDRI